jgi:hypothetical protein
MSRRVYRSNAQWVRALYAGPDEQSRELAKTLAIQTSTVSPASRGAGRWGNQGLSGDIAHCGGGLNPSPQEWQGVDVRSIQSAGVHRYIGDIQEGGLPHTTGVQGSSLAWMNLGRIPGVGYGS